MARWAGACDLVLLSAMRMYMAAASLVWMCSIAGCGDDDSGTGTGTTGGTTAADDGADDGSASESTAVTPGDGTSSSGSDGGTTQAGTGSSSGAVDSSESGQSTGVVFDPCAEVETTLFASVEPQECGQGPMGPEMCNWTIRFDNMAGYHWEYSDVAEDGTVACEGEAIVGTPMGGGGPRMGTFDPATMTLTWEGVDYQ